MGIFDIFKSKGKTEGFKESDVQSVLKRAAEIYRQTTEEMDKLLAELHRVWEGLGERDVAILHAANDGLIPAPAHLTSRLEILRRISMEVDRRLTEAGADPKTVEAEMGDNEAAALVLLQRQSWWPEFIAHVRAEKGIRIADDIGRWTNATKKLAPYIYEAGRMYQTPDDYRKNGPITQWTWRVDLTAGTVEREIDYLGDAIEQYERNVYKAAENQFEYCCWYSWGVGAYTLLLSLRQIPGFRETPDSLDKARALLELGMQPMISIWYGSLSRRPA